MLHTYMLASPAWLSLSTAARSVYVQLLSRYNGSNNGSLGFSLRCASIECKIAINTAKRAFQELQDRGFIVQTRKGYFTMKIKHASEWLLTAFRDNRTGEIPERRFMNVQI